MLNPFEDYRAFALSTASYPGAGKGGLPELAYLGLGLAGEAGEVVDALKKLVRIGDPSTPQEMAFCAKQKEEAAKELGDVLYYWIRLCDALNVSPMTVLQNNVAKLEARKASGTLKIHE